MKKKKIRQRNLGELMGGILPALTQTKEATPNQTQPNSNVAAQSSNSTQNLTSKPSRTALPSLKRTPSFSVKNAMAGKVSAPSAENQVQPNTTNSNNSSNYDASEEDEDNFETTFEEVELNSKNLENAWSRFADHIKTARPRIYHTLQSTKPNLIDDTLVTFDVVNSSQKEDLTSISNELVNFLRRSLGAPILELEFNVSDIESQNARPYTVEEKFKHMIVKNPALLNLKQALGLDFE